MSEPKRHAGNRKTLVDKQLLPVKFAVNSYELFGDKNVYRQKRGLVVQTSFPSKMRGYRRCISRGCHIFLKD